MVHQSKMDHSEPGPKGIESLQLHDPVPSAEAPNGGFLNEEDGGWTSVKKRGNGSRRRKKSSERSLTPGEKEARWKRLREEGLVIDFEVLQSHNMRELLVMLLMLSHLKIHEQAHKLINNLLIRVSVVGSC